MNLLVLMHQFANLSGAEKLSLDLARRWPEFTGGKSHIAMMYSRDYPEANEAAARLESEGYARIHFLDLKPHPSPVYLFDAVMHVRRIIKTHDISVVESNMSTPNLMNMWATRSLSVVPLVGCHDVFLRSRHNDPKWKFLRFSSWANKHVFHYAITRYTCECWTRFLNLPTHRVRIIYNSINDTFFNTTPDRTRFRAMLGIDEKAKVVLFVGRMVARKGIDILYEAVQPLLKEENAVLVFVGPTDAETCDGIPGESATFDALLNRIRADMSEDRVKILGSRSDVDWIMASSDVLAHPPRIEGFGLVLAEAMAAGVPVVATDVDGIPEVVKGSGAILVPREDPLALRNAVRSVLRWSQAEGDRAVLLGKITANRFKEETRMRALIDYVYEIRQISQKHVVRT